MALILIFLLAFGLRLYDLEGQSMWSDEGLSLYRAQQPLAVVLANTITVDGVVTTDTNPPFYFLLLHGWRALLGESVFLLRYVGVLVALLSIPLIYGLGRTLYSAQVGILAALFLAVSPFHVWQTQVLRNYGLLITINLLSVYGLARYAFAFAAEVGRPKWAALWMVAGVLGIYTHYFGFLIFAFTLAAFAAAVALRRRAGDGAGRRRMWLALLLIAALALPALLAALARFRAGRQIDFFDVDALGVAVQAASAFSVGMSPTLTHPWSWVATGLLLFAAGIWLGWRQTRGGTLLLIAYQVLPLGIVLALSTINPLFNGTRHLLIGLPPFLLLCAILPGALIRERATFYRLALFVAALFIVIQVVWLQRQFHHPDLVRDDVRAVAEYLNRMADPEDNIILHDTLIKFSFDHYYDGAAPVTAVPLFGRQDESEAIARLQAAGEQGETIWFLIHPEPRTGFPRNLLSEWAEEHWHRLSSEGFPWLWLPLQLRAYSVEPEQAVLPPEATEQQAQYGDGLQLHGLTMPDTLQSGAPFAATFYLSQNGGAGSDYEISLRFRDGEGRHWQQVDQSLWPAYPPASWPANGMVRYEHITQLPAGLPPGVYQVWMRLIDHENNRPLALATGGTDLRLPDVKVDAAACERAQSPWPNYVADGDLFGTSLILQGHTEPAAAYRPGHLLSVELLWCVRRPPQQALSLSVALIDGRGDVQAESAGSLTRADYPFSEWQPNQLLQGHVQLPVPGVTDAGTYHLRLAVVPQSGGAALPVNLGFSGRAADVTRIEVEEWPMETTFPPIANPFTAEFGEPLLFELHGYDVDVEQASPGDRVPITFYWRSAVDAPPINYFAFVHLIQEGEQPAAQTDGPPLNGFRLTSSWRAGEVFVDERTLVIPEDVEPGFYRLMVGLYNPDTGQRLPAFINGEQQQDDSILLEQLPVAP